MAPRFRELGVTGLHRSSGHIFEEFLPQLQGKNGIRVYTEMYKNDPIIGAIMYALTMFLRKVPWHVDPKDDSEQAEQYATFFRECMDDMSHTWAEFIAESTSQAVYGFSYHEIVYKRRNGFASMHSDGLVGWRKMPIRAQSSIEEWVFDDEGGIRGVIQRTWPDFDAIFIPIEKALLFCVRPERGNPEGVSLLRNAYRPWYFKKRLEETEGVGIERDLAGIPVVYVPAELFTAEGETEKSILADFKNLVRNIRNDEQTGIIFPQAWDKDGHELYRLELMSASGGRTFDTNSIIERYDRRIAMTVLADFLLLGQADTGSYALSVSKTGMFRASLSSILDSIAGILNDYAIPRLMRMNSMSLDLAPKFRPGDIQGPDLETYSAFVTAMVGAGWRDILKSDVKEVLLKEARLPVPDNMDDTVAPEPSQSGQEAPQGGQGGPQKAPGMSGYQARNEKAEQRVKQRERLEQSEGA